MNNKLDWVLLKKLYSIHSPSGKEERMIQFICSYLMKVPGVVLDKDIFGNLYARKGVTDNYPCVVCHVDQVQKIHSRDFKAVETRDIIFGFSTNNHSFEGLGGDDKNGILIALEALKKYDCIKAVFFREEETGCRGSSNCNLTFFNDCRFVIECDRRGNSDLITTIGSTDLCSEKFINDIDPEKWGYVETQGMMTDVEVLKERGLSVSAINMSCGYYNPHTDEEITVKRDLMKCWLFVQHIIEDCSCIYPHETGDYDSLYDDWELEEEIHSILSNDPYITPYDLFDMYQTNFPMLDIADFERIVEEHRLIYGWEDETYSTTKIETNGKKKENGTLDI